MGLPAFQGDREGCPLYCCKAFGYSLFSNFMSCQITLGASTSPAGLMGMSPYSTATLSTWWRGGVDAVWNGGSREAATLAWATVHPDVPFQGFVEFPQIRRRHLGEQLYLEIGLHKFTRYLKSMARLKCFIVEKWYDNEEDLGNLGISQFTFARGISNSPLESLAGSHVPSVVGSVRFSCSAPVFYL